MASSSFGALVLVALVLSSTVSGAAGGRPAPGGDRDAPSPPKEIVVQWFLDLERWQQVLLCLAVVLVCLTFIGLMLRACVRGWRAARERQNAHTPPHSPSPDHDAGVCAKCQVAASVCEGCAHLCDAAVGMAGCIGCIGIS